MKQSMPEAWKCLNGLKLPHDPSTPDLRLEVGQYENGRIAVTAICDGSDPEPWCKLTVNMVEHQIGENQFFVKLHDRAAYELALELLVRQLIVRIGTVVSSGFVQRYAELWEVANA